MIDLIISIVNYSDSLNLYDNLSRKSPKIKNLDKYFYKSLNLF
jgi:hypothetical protein